VPATDPIAARLATFIKLEIAIKGMTHAAIKMAPMDMATHRRWLQQNSSLSSLSFWETNADAVTCCEFIEKLACLIFSCEQLVDSALYREHRIRL